MESLSITNHGPTIDGSHCRFCGKVWPCPSQADTELLRKLHCFLDRMELGKTGAGETVGEYRRRIEDHLRERGEVV